MGALAIITIIISIILVLVVLIQNSKGGGIASNFASNTQVVGVKKQAEYIEKFTWAMISLLMILCIASGVNSGTVQEKEKEESALKNATVPTANAPLTVPTNPNATNAISPVSGGTGSTGPK